MCNACEDLKHTERIQALEARLEEAKNTMARIKAHAVAIGSISASVGGLALRECHRAAIKEEAQRFLSEKTV